MKRVSIVASALLALSSTAAHAVTFETGAGFTHFNTEDGRWIQTGGIYSKSVTPPSWSFGITGDVWATADYGVALHLNYVWLGKVSSSCSCTPMDENYSTAKHAVLHLYDVPNAQFNGSGNVQGIAATVEPWFKYDGWRFAAEGGAFAFRPKFDETITGWQVIGSGAPQTLNVSTPRGVQVVPVVGASIGRGNWSIRYRHYMLKQANSRYKTYPPLWQDADQIEYVLKF